MIICEYGCGKESKYQFKNGKYCCENHYLKCPNQKKQLNGDKNPFFGKVHTEESKRLTSDKNKGKIPWNVGIPRTEEEKKKISMKTKEAMLDPELREKLRRKPKLSKSYHPRWTGGYYSKGIPLYNTYADQISYAEDCRRNKDDKNVLEVKCAYCGKWFIPLIPQVYERMRSLEGKNYGEQRIYCSEQCKIECPIYHQILYPKGYKSTTSREVQPELRQLRFKIDNYTCQKCGKNQSELDCGLHCHHVEGVRWEPLESADLDKCITYCKDCHKEAHEKEGCNYYDMRCPQE
jgi:hypothetical protein